MIFVKLSSKLMAFVCKTLPILCLFCIRVVLVCVYPKIVRGDDRPFVAMDRIKKINQNLPAGNGERAVLVEEDIRLPSPESEAARGEFSNAMRLKFKLWPGGIVPYVIDQSITKRPGHLRVLLEAMKVWEEKTCIRFVNKTNEFPYAYIHYGEDGCNSNIGTLSSKPSVLSLGQSCNVLSVAAHELGHLLGFGHEQSRPDRDAYVKILWENISPADHRIFRKQSHWIFHSLGVQYDYRSLMHYGAYTYSNNGKPTIESRDPTIKSFGSNLPSELDIKQMNLMYSCPEVPIFPDHFSIGSARPKMECIAINQSQDAEWGTRFLCYKPTLQRLNVTWSQNGSITGLDCINTVMPFENAAEVWKTSYLCVPRNSLLKFRWSVSRPIRGLGCLRVRKRKKTKEGYFLCGVPKHKKIDGGWSAWSYWRSCTQQCGGGFRLRTRSCDSPLPQFGGAQCRGSSFHTISCNTHWCPEWPSWPSDFKFLYLSFTPKREECISIYERLQYEQWKNARLCWPSNKRQITIRWSDQGPVNDMRCIHVTQQPGWYQPNGWRDNYLCTKNVPYRFKWSTNGPIKGLACLKWQNDRFLRSNLWQNNYLCADEYPIPTRAPRTGCLPGWQPFAVGKVFFCYLEVRYQRHSWAKAYEYCREKKANLASIVSEEEFKFLRRFTRKNIWLGLKMQRSWQWSDRNAVSFTKWSPGEPNNGNGGPPEKCALSRGTDGKWNDFPCNTKFNFVCKMKGVTKT